MTRWLHEYWIAAALFAVAAVVPLVWASVDSQRRLELKGSAFTICLGHRKQIADCMHLRPEAFAPGTAQVCEMRHLPRQCWDMMHGVTP